MIIRRGEDEDEQLRVPYKKWTKDNVIAGHYIY